MVDASCNRLEEADADPNAASGKLPVTGGGMLQVELYRNTYK